MPHARALRVDPELVQLELASEREVSTVDARVSLTPVRGLPSGTVWIEAGRWTELELELDPDFVALQGSRARLAGRITFARAALDGLESELGPRCAAAGETRRSAIALRVSGPAHAAAIEFELGPAGATDFALDFETQRH